MNDTISTAVYKMIIQSKLQTSNNVVSGSADQHASVTDAWNVNYSESDVVESVYLTPNQITLNNVVSGSAYQHASITDAWNVNYGDSDVVESVYLTPNQIQELEDQEASKKPLHVNVLNTWDLLLKSSHAGLDTDVMTIGTDEHVADDKNLQPVTEKLCIVKERQNLWKPLYSIMLLLYVASASATRSIDLKPPENYTVFQNDTPAIFSCYGNGFGTGAVVSWSLNGTGYGTQHAQMGITYVIDPPTGATVSSHLIVSTNSTINNNTQVICRTADVTFSNVLTSLPANLTIQGPLQPPTNFTVIVSNTSNTTFLLSWGAPFSLNVTDSPDIFNYTLCTNITMYGCRIIPSNPDCIFNGTNLCNSSVDFTDHSLNGTIERQKKTIMDYGDPIHFTFFAVNGAGNGSKANFTYSFKMESGGNLAPSQTEPKSTNIVPTTTTLSSNHKSENLIPEIAVSVVGVCFFIVVVLIIVLLVIVIKRHGTKRKQSGMHCCVEPPVELHSHQENTTITANDQTKTSESHYIDVACHPIITIPAPHHNVQYSEVKPQNEKPAIQHPHWVEFDSEDNGNESKDSTWCPPSGQAQQTTTDRIATGVDLAAKHADVSEFTQRKLLEPAEHLQTLSSDLSDIKSFIQESYYNPCEGTDDISPVFAFVSIVTPQCTKLSPTVLVHECNATSLNAASHHNVVQKSLVITADVNKATSDTIETECNSDNSHILKDDQNYTDSTNDNQDDSVSNKVAGQIIFETKTAFVENGPPWMPLAVNILQCEWLPWDTSPFYTTGKASPHWSTPKQSRAKKYQCLEEMMVLFLF